MRTKTIAPFAAIIAAFSLAALDGAPGMARAQSEHRTEPGAAEPDTAVKEPVYAKLPGYGKKCWIGETAYFTYRFDKKPAMGTAILIVRVFDKSGARITSLSITGDSDMPSMRGAHASGEVPFKLNKKGDYLLPVNVVMPGEWEVRLIFGKGGETIYRGAFRFGV